jgi:hypothetical protein
MLLAFPSGRRRGEIEKMRGAPANRLAAKAASHVSPPGLFQDHEDGGPTTQIPAVDAPPHPLRKGHDTAIQDRHRASKSTTRKKAQRWSALVWVE